MFFFVALARSGLACGADIYAKVKLVFSLSKYSSARSTRRALEWWTVTGG
jgi:hypothetical protein